MATMEFCDECNNMLYPKEDKERGVLTYVCRRCKGMTKQAKQNCVYRNDIKGCEGYKFQNIVWSEMIDDPSLPRARLDKGCEKCKNKDVVIIQHMLSDSKTMNPVTIHFVCTNPNCMYHWKETKEKKKKKEN